MDRSIVKRIILIVFACLLLTPFLYTGFYFDDSINSLIRSWGESQDAGAWESMKPALVDRFVRAGRLYPVGQIIGYSLWYYLFHNLLVYRFFQLALVLVNMIQLMDVMGRIPGGRNYRGLVWLLLPALFQLRSMHDPISSYQALFQNIFLFGFGAIQAYQRYQQGSRMAWLVVSSVLFLVSLLTYEVALVFLPLFVWLAWCARKEKGLTLKAVIPHVVLATLYLIAVFIIRYKSSLVYDGTRISLSPRLVVTYLSQLSAAFPLSYAVFGHSGNFPLSALWKPPFLSVATFTVMFVGVFLSSRFLGSEHKWRDAPDSHEVRPLLGFALILLLVPPVFVALSERYQDMIKRPGIGYLPVYISYFGMAILLAIGCNRFVRRDNMGVKKMAVILAFGLVVGLNFAANRLVVERMNAFWRYPRDLVERAGVVGLFKGLPDRALVLIPERYHSWLVGWRFQQFSGVAASPQQIQDWAVAKKVPKGWFEFPERTFYLYFSAQGNGEGLVYIAPVSGMEWDPESQQVKVLRSSGSVRIALFSRRAESVGVNFGRSEMPPGSFELSSDPGCWMAQVPFVGQDLKPIRIQTQ
jgi:hypothetical protein